MSKIRFPWCSCSFVQHPVSAECYWPSQGQTPQPWGTVCSVCRDRNIFSGSPALQAGLGADTAADAHSAYKIQRKTVGYTTTCLQHITLHPAVLHMQTLQCAAQEGHFHCMGTAVGWLATPCNFLQPFIVQLCLFSSIEIVSGWLQVFKSLSVQKKKLQAVLNYSVCMWTGWMLRTQPLKCQLL